ncbi:hypothetical protein [Candidatus Uabimicrobium sp. HlEnr_7]|uniref:hypothetical protein n=1 Tax=Candidatus Uabimicrobium helgolandensis TaxID=3095367 RepID=UPI0035578113
MKNLLSFLLALLFLCSPLFAKEYYVSANRGKGKKASKKKPAKDLGNIIKKLKAGDTINIAGGIYYGKGRNGYDHIQVPVKIIGGWNDSFTKRDPWGEHKTVLSGDNKSRNFKSMHRLHIDISKYRKREVSDIVVDGIIVDNAARNQYKSDKQLEIIRVHNPRTKQYATPESGGIFIRSGKTGNFRTPINIRVENCIVMNTAPNRGALSVFAYKNGKAVIRNNLVINNTGTGIFAGASFHSRNEEGWPQFTIENNSVLFTWKHDPLAGSYSGVALEFDARIRCTITNNVFAFSDRFSISNTKRTPILLQNNLFGISIEGDYLEFDTRIALEDIEDEAEYLHEDSEENYKENFKVHVNSEWAKVYGGRALVDRNAVEADVSVQKTSENNVRSILGLPVQGTNIGEIATSGWLNRMMLEDAIQTGSNKFKDVHGCSIPK